MLQSVIVAVLALVALYFLQGPGPELLADTKRFSKVVRLLRQNRLKFQFSLQTLLITIMLMALLFGFALWLNHTPS